MTNKLNFSIVAFTVRLCLLCLPCLAYLGPLERAIARKFYATEMLSKWKMICYDADDGIFGLDSNDPQFGIEIVKAKVPQNGGIGIVFVEYLRLNDKRKMTLIDSIVPGSNAERSGMLKIGDTITYIGQEPDKMVRIEGLGLDETVTAFNEVPQGLATLVIVAKRLVERAHLNITFINSNNDEAKYSLLAGSNLRTEMMKKNIQVYDSRTKRFDQPYITGDCGGEGICGTCVVEVLEGMDKLNKLDRVEEMILRSRPRNWRLSCRTVVGADNKPGEVKFRILPQLYNRNRSTRKGE